MSGSIVTPPDFTQKSAFGEKLVVEPSSITSQTFPYNINPVLIKTRVNNSGTVAQSGVSVAVKTAAGTNSFAQLLTKRLVRYVPGQGLNIRSAGFFTAPATGSSTYVGYGSINDGFFFGYSDNVFGVLRLYGGSSEVRTLTITTKSSNVESITITLNGVTKSVPVTNGADTTVTANDIASADYSNTGGGWETEAVGSTVIFRSYASGPLSGSYSLSGATSAVGTFAQTVAGVAATYDFTPKSSWSEDQCDGTKRLPVLDHTKGNVYQIQVQYLGYGDIEFSIEHPTTGELVLVHRIHYANANTSPSINNPTLPLCVMATNTTNNTQVGFTFSSIGAFREGPNNVIGPHRAATSAVTGVTTERPVLTIRNKSVYASKLNRVFIRVELFNVAVDGTKTAQYKMYKDATLVGASFTDIDTNTSPIQFDVAATSFTLGAGRLMAAGGLAKSDSAVVTHMDDPISTLYPGEQLTITVSSTASTDTVSSFTWEELF